MSNGPSVVAIDLIRWTFTIDAIHRQEIETHLTDLGLVVLEDGKFIATWEEPGQETDTVIEEIWALNGEPFEVVQEDFHRLGLHVLHDDGEPLDEGREVA